MIKPVLILCCLIFLLTACVTSSTAALTPTNTLVQMIPSETDSVQPLIPTSTITPTSLVVLTNTPMPPTEIPTQGINVPEITSVCPTPLEIPLENFDLNEFVLVVAPYDPTIGKLSPEVAGASIVELDNPSLQSIPETTEKNGWKLLTYRAALDGKTLELVYEDASKTRQQVWRSSFDGKEQEMIAEYMFEPLPKDHALKQISDSTYLLYRMDLENFSDYPIAIYNQITGEKTDVPPFPDDVVLRNIFFIDGTYYLLYDQGAEIDGMYLYNLTTFTSTPVFQWLWGAENVFSLNTFVDFENGRFNVRVIRPYGVDFGIQLDLTAITAPLPYNEAMQTIHLPGEDDQLMEGYLLENLQSFLFWRSNEDRPPVYLLELNTLVLKKYCFFAENFLVSDIYNRISISPDQRYVAFTKINYGISDVPDTIKSVEILDLLTGEYTTIPNANFEVIGWIIR